MRQLKINAQITERTQITDKYISEISPIQLITSEKEIELAQRIKKGDKEALDQLVRANLRFVISCAKQYQNRGVPLDDLINEGNLGLIKAAERFDETRGFKFISYAVGWIRQSMIDSIYRNSRTVRMPSNKINQLNKLREVTSRLLQENEGNISHSDVCLEMEIDHTTYALLVSDNASISMDKKLREDDDVTLHDFIKEENSSTDVHLGEISMREQLHIALSCLSEFEKKIILDSFGINEENRELTLDELAQLNGYSSERIRQLRIKCLAKMKKFLEKGFGMKSIDK